MNRDYAIDAIRLFSILGVVIIHVSTAFTDRVAPLSGDFFIYHFINQIFRFSVPLFFLISGYLLASRYSKIENIVDFYKRRLSKVLLPYLSWSVIYYVLVFPNPVQEIFTQKFLMVLTQGDASYQLYFIPAIILLYLFFPLIIYYKKYLLTKWFIVALILFQVIPTYLFYINVKMPVLTPIRIGFYNLLPFVFGMYAAIRIKDLAKFVTKYIIPISVITIILGAIVFMESTIMFIRTTISEYLKNQWRISVALYGISIGALFYYLYPRFFVKFEKIISYLASFALGIFFVHVAILSFVLQFFDAHYFNFTTELLLTLSLTIFLSVIFSITLSRIKIINQLLGLRG